MAANLYFQPHYTTTEINLHSRNKLFLPIINCSFSFVQNACSNICITLVKLSLQSPPHPTTRTHNRASSNKPKWKQTNIWGGRRVSIVFIHALIHSFIYSFVSLSIHSIYISRSPHLRRSHMKQGANKDSPCAQPQADRRPTYNNVQLDSARKVQWYST